VPEELGSLKLPLQSCQSINCKIKPPTSHHQYFKLNPKNQNFNLVTRVKINYSQKQKTHFNKNEKNGIFNCSTSIYIIDLTNNIVTPKFHIT